MLALGGATAEAVPGTRYDLPVPVLDLRQRSPSETRPSEAVQPTPGPRVAPERRLCCASCGSLVTSERERIPIDGRHVHRRTNPGGLTFEFGCFALAPGADVVGEPTLEFTWFPDYAWTYALCRACQTHLGWHFEGAEPPFHGLILNRLRPGAHGEKDT